MIGVSEYIRNNYTEYTGDAGFLVGATERTKKLMKIVEDAVSVERRHNGVLDIDTATVATITAFPPGYIDKHNELIVGLQTDSLLKRAMVPFGGLNMVKASCGAYNRKVSPEVLAKFEHRVTHNEGVFRMYTDEMKTARKAGVLTGLPDSYGRGRIIGDYRRVALFGVDSLIEAKQAYKSSMADKSMGINEAMLLEETYVQIQALQDLKRMAKSYGYDISKPATTAREAIQWLYFAYLGAIKEQNGAAMSLGRVSTFLDIYIEKDIQAGLLDELGAQELIDDFVLKLRVARHLRTPEYNELFGGDPMWITEAVGGMREDGLGSLVTKTSFRVLNTLYTLGESPEPNLTVLWSESLPKGFKEYCAKVSIDTCAIQYENDDLMRHEFGDDYAISCCVSAMRVGKDMQFFGARLNLPKLLLLALNGGYDTDSKLQVGPKGEVYRKEVLDYKEIDALYSMYRDWAAKLYVNTMNLIHISHDKYAYEGLEMALHDDDPHRYMAFGLAGVSVFADSMSAIKHAEVKPLYNEAGYVVDFVVTGRYPLYGNDDDRVDLMLRDYVNQFYSALTSHKTYRDAEHTLSLLTITSNVMYGRKTGNTPDGRRAGEAYAPGANPMPNREREGALSSLNSVAKLDYCNCKDGISNTFSLLPATLGATDSCRVANLVTVLDGYFENKGHHLNVNVLNRGKLLAAYTNPDMHPNLTIRVSGYAVDFHKLSKEHQLEVIQRTYHEVF